MAPSMWNAATPSQEAAHKRFAKDAARHFRPELPGYQGDCGGTLKGELPCRPFLSVEPVADIVRRCFCA